MKKSVSCGIIDLIIAHVVRGLFIGLGVAPFYPNFSFLTPKHFGEKNSQKAMGVQMASAFIGIVVFPSLMGILSSKLGIKFLAPYLAILLGILTLSYMFYKNFEKKN